MNPFGISGMLAGVSSLGLGVLVLLKSTNRRLARIWFLFALSVAMYGFMVAWATTTENATESLLAWKITYGLGVIWIAPSFYHFICTFLEITDDRFIWWHHLIGLAFTATLPTSLFFSHVKWLFGSFYDGQAGPLMGIYLLWWMGLVFFSHVRLWQAYKKVTAQKKTQIVYFFIATGIGFTGGSLCYLPQFGILLYPWGNFTVCLYPLIMSYAILKHQLMDVTVVIRKTLVYSLVSAVLISVYVGTITLAAQTWGGRHGPTSVFSSALAAIFITLLFNPLRLYTQRWIDRHFPRETLDPVLLQEAAGGFAHEMKRPLSKISLPAELALMDLEKLQSGKKTLAEALPAIKERLLLILSQSVDAGYMIEAVRELSASAVLPFEPVDLIKVIKIALSVEKDLLQRRGVSAALNLPRALPSVSGRARQLEIVFVNLIKNAAEAMGDLPAGQARNLTIEGESNGPSVIIRVKDSGPGIKPEDLAKVFQPNYTTKGAKGTGMGLYLSQQIVQVHSGTIEVQSESGSGTTLFVSLPVRKGN